MMDPIPVAVPAEMESLGRRLAAALQPGDILLLNGSLGAGKTLFISGIAQALGVEVQVTSPTFLVVRDYEGVLPLTHVDVYRLSSTAEFTDLELVEAAADGVLAIEWGSAVRSALPSNVLSIDIEVGEGDMRSVTFRGEGEWDLARLAELTI